MCTGAMGTLQESRETFAVEQCHHDHNEYDPTKVGAGPWSSGPSSEGILSERVEARWGLDNLYGFLHSLELLTG
jgi:hypothetical protein